MNHLQCGKKTSEIGGHQPAEKVTHIPLHLHATPKQIKPNRLVGEEPSSQVNPLIHVQKNLPQLNNVGLLYKVKLTTLRNECNEND